MSLALATNEAVLDSLSFNANDLASMPDAFEFFNAQGGIPFLKPCLDAQELVSDFSLFKISLSDVSYAVSGSLAKHVTKNNFTAYDETVNFFGLKKAKRYNVLDVAVDEASSIYMRRFGKHCSERLVMLISCSFGWDGGDAESISYSSLYKSLQLLKLLDLSQVGSKASVFMDHKGHVSFSWPTDKENNLIEIFFRPDSVNVYTDVDDEDLIFDSVDMDLISHISRYM
ncbi:hypothetical protein [Halomonas sp. HAL1]|uniref:hypothetical protein n=1 Tax=Halomonas sp. HAL1 TaxID=550984 RepID=UPI00022D2DE3|nr:hypothetical protein [Halomonas sp. HAL1]EHA16582.1 hypothetical protein HAL1_05893 [Halomonas sp. HAL1]WKV93306.1 hypothetical protein Q3Y66_01310 [Halomonas sp. HAL1]